MGYRYGMRFYLFFLMITMLCGCWNSARQEQTATVRTEERVGIEAGQPTQLTTTTTERTTTEAQAQAGPDMAKALTAALAGFKGDLMGALAALKPAEQKPAGGLGLDMNGGIAGAATGLGLLALREWMARRQAQAEKDKARAEVDEEYQRANAAQKRAEEYARMLPPPTSPVSTITNGGGNAG